MIMKMITIDDYREFEVLMNCFCLWLVKSWRPETLSHPSGTLIPSKDITGDRVTGPPGHCLVPRPGT